MPHPHALRARRALLTAAVAAGFMAFPGSPPPAQAATSCGTAALIAVNRSSGSLNRWRTTAVLTKAPGDRTTLAGGSTSIRLLASDTASGALFSVWTDGSVRRQVAAGSGLSQPVTVGSGWSKVRAVVPAGRGVLYTLDTAGQLRWYRWLDGDRWAAGSGRVLARDWTSVRLLAGGGDGVLYTVLEDGRAQWWSAADPTTGKVALRGPSTLATGWGGITAMAGGGDGLLYTINRDGLLKRRNHLGSANGVASWAKPVALGTGWSGYRALTLNTTACSSPADRAQKYARAQVGDPYRWGGTGPDSWDCSGLTGGSWARGGITLPRVSRDQFTSRGSVRLPFSQRRPGDLVFWSSNGAQSGIYHVAQYVGNDKVVSAPSTGQLVRVQDMYSTNRMSQVVRPTG